MLRCLVSSAVRIRPKLLSNVTQVVNSPKLIYDFSALRQFSTLLNVPKIQPATPQLAVTRSLTKCSWKKGTKRSNKAVLRRFYRLAWGGWIRTKCGRHKSLWKKSPPRKRRLRQHVLCNSTQSTLLDKMVCKYWRKPKYYVDDPYEPYHQREEFYYSAVKPRPYFPPEEEKQ